MNNDISKHLGKSTVYEQTYNNNLLVREARQNNRTHLGIDSNNLKFKGFDIWNAYEVSFLNKNKAPNIYVLKLKYSADSKYIVESKSLKLYLNSFNMTVINSTDEFKDIIINDLSNLLECDVYAELHNKYNSREELSEYINIDNMITNIDLINSYTENDSLLHKISDDTYITKISSSILRSRCKVTHQPDWGTVYIYIDRRLNLIDILKYIISFRNENHFHEEVVETIYTKLMNIYNPDTLMVLAKYTRRGGIDINPVRYSKNFNTKDINDFLNINKTHIKVFNQ